MTQHRSTPSSSLRVDLLPLSSQSGYYPLKSPSFNKPRRAYQPFPSRRQRAILRALAWLALGFVLILGLWAWRTDSSWDTEVREPHGIPPHYGSHDSFAPHHGPGRTGHRHHHKAHGRPSTHGPPRITLSNDQKLAAITSFILSPLHSNSLPSYSENANSVQVEDLLEFNLDNPRAKDMLSQMVHEIWDTEKVIIYGKLHHGPTRMLKKHLDMWEFPPPAVVELDKRDDGAILETLLKPLIPSSAFLSSPDSGDNTDHWTLPLLIVRGTPFVGVERVKEVYYSGELERILKAGI